MLANMQFRLTNSQRYLVVGLVGLVVAAIVAVLTAIATLIQPIVWLGWWG